MVAVKRFEFWLVSLSPTQGSEISKSRPCLIISPNESNKYLNTVIVIPLTSAIKLYPTRINCTFEEKEGQLAIDQIRTVDKVRLIKKLGNLKPEIAEQLCQVLIETFKY